MNLKEPTGGAAYRIPSHLVTPVVALAVPAYWLHESPTTVERAAEDSPGKAPKSASFHKVRAIFSSGSAKGREMSRELVGRRKKVQTEGGERQSTLLTDSGSSPRFMSLLPGEHQEEDWN